MNWRLVTLDYLMDIVWIQSVLLAQVTGIEALVSLLTFASDLVEINLPRQLILQLSTLLCFDLLASKEISLGNLICNLFMRAVKLKPEVLYAWLEELLSRLLISLSYECSVERSTRPTVKLIAVFDLVLFGREVTTVGVDPLGLFLNLLAAESGLFLRSPHRDSLEIESKHVARRSVWFLILISQVKLILPGFRLLSSRLQFLPRFSLL